MKEKILAIIPARSGSKRVPNKNIKDFLGKPLIAYTIEQALASDLIDRVVVDTDSPEIAEIAKKYGAEVPFLRPKELAQDNSLVIDSLMYTINKLKEDEGYEADYLMILQSTSPLREQQDIIDCVNLMKEGGATTVLTVSPTHPKFYHLDENNYTVLVNGSEDAPNNTQTWPKGYLLNGCIVFLTEMKALFEEKKVITKKTRAVISPKWRSVDVDTPEEWVMAEVLYKNKDFIYERLKEF